ncbi:5-methyltetrahydropteroyltriglutamate--homocysteine methyltransferase [archaeon BMS3Bbin15]|nr:5-methyltetrahydropteroyltriglutamate--homocysteine methyltransferase [archaeon BMS3Bbin15]
MYINLMVIIDDIGSFPLPYGTVREEFNRIYPEVMEACAEGEKLENKPEFGTFTNAVKESLWRKINSDLDVVNYPQHFDMHRQFLEPLMKHQTEPFIVDRKYAVIPELYVAEQEAKRYYEEKGEALKLKVCVTGAIELYLKTDFGYNIYEEVLLNIAESVNRFVKNSLLNTKYIKTEVVSIDEPSLGFVDLLNIDKEGIIKALDKSVEGTNIKKQIHLHTLKASEYPLNSDNIDVITGEFASTPKNMELISKRELERNDKFIRAGVVSTNIDYKLGKLAEKGIKKPNVEMLVDTYDYIENIYRKLKGRFGDRIAFAGPDCGLGSWPSQEAAQEVLRRAVEVVRKVDDSTGT